MRLTVRVAAIGVAAVAVAKHRGLCRTVAPLMRALQPERRISAQRSDLVYYALGQGPALLFANGLGASWRGFRNQLTHLADRYRCLFWDYRGVFADRERARASGVRNGLADHAADALAILHSEGVERAAVLGW